MIEVASVTGVLAVTVTVVRVPAVEVMMLETGAVTVIYVVRVVTTSGIEAVFSNDE